MSRRPHTKSRRGCTACKASHVKCDCTLPVCGRCTRIDAKCSLAEELGLVLVPRGHASNNPGPSKKTPTSDASSSGAQSSIPSPGTKPPNGDPHRLQQVHSNEPSETSTTGHATPYLDQNFSPDSSRSLPAAPATPALNMIDLDLMHQYLTRTAKTISQQPGLHDLFGDLAVRLALSYPFLMHSILAYAGHHKIHLLNTAEWELDAGVEQRSPNLRHVIMQHESAGYSLHLLRVSGNTDFAQGEREALCLCAILLFIMALSSHTIVDPSLYLSRPNAGIDKAIELFRLARGAMVCFQLDRQAVARGPLSPMLSILDPGALEPLDDSTATALSRLQQRVTAWTDRDSQQRSSSGECVRAIECLRIMFRRLASSCPDSALVFGWLYLTEGLADWFIGDVERGDTNALIILSYWAAGLSKLRFEWWELGWGQRIVSDVINTIGDEAVLDWPRSVVGLDT